MAYPLDGCYAKLDRAREHLEQLRGATEAWYGTTPQRIVGEFDPATGLFTFVAPHTGGSFREWGAIIGDVVHNLRASLDYLAWELSVRHVGIAHGDRTAIGVAFPIYEEAKGFYRDGVNRPFT